MASTQESDQHRLTNFFNEEYYSLKAFVRSRIGDSSDRDAEDIVQDVAVRIFSRPGDATPISNIGGFVYNAIRNRIVDLMRTNKGSSYEYYDMERRWEEFADLVYGQADNSYSPKLEKALKTAIEQLKPEYRDIIIAVDFEGYGYREIAEESDISMGTLMSRRHRALSILAKMLETEKNKN